MAEKVKCVKVLRFGLRQATDLVHAVVLGMLHLHACLIQGNVKYFSVSVCESSFSSILINILLFMFLVLWREEGVIFERLCLSRGSTKHSVGK